MNKHSLFQYSFHCLVSSLLFVCTETEQMREYRDCSVWKITHTTPLLNLWNALYLRESRCDAKSHSEKTHHRLSSPALNSSVWLISRWHLCVAQTSMGTPLVHLGVRPAWHHDLRRISTETVRQNNKSKQNRRSQEALGPQNLSSWTLMNDWVFNQVKWTHSRVETSNRCGNRHRCH